MKRLKKELGLFDVFAISTGAMFSSGFFLLPGLAAAKTGPSVALAYLVASVFILPAMFSVAELATAMPRAGGAYYFLDRSMGPLVGTIGGLGAWIGLILKSAFALVGMGAYLALYFDVPIKPLAVAFTLLFTVINIIGAKETGGLQRLLVTALLVILGAFMVEGLLYASGGGALTAGGSSSTTYFEFGLGGFMATVGFVFVSYAGLTKVASVAEEIQNPDRNIPLGMMLSLGTAAVSYSVGVWVIVAVVPAAELHTQLTPVAAAATSMFGWLPAGAGVLAIVIAAVAAFASTGNAGILSASRYPLAMARDHLVPRRLGRLGRFHTPTESILWTSLTIIACVLVLDVEGIAKLASAFVLLLFALLNLAVIIMRESGIEGYDPGYSSPLYPWMQLFGFLSPFWLIAEMGQDAVLFTLGLLTLTATWYFYYAHPKVTRAGAIFHTLARLGERRHDGLEVELREIVRERGLLDGDPFEELVARAPVLDFGKRVRLSGLLEAAARDLAEMTGVPEDTLVHGFLEERGGGFVSVSPGVALFHLRVADLDRPALLFARCAQGFVGSPADPDGRDEDMAEVRAVFCLVSPKAAAALHLRLLGALAAAVADPVFLDSWSKASSEPELRATLIGTGRALTVRLGDLGLVPAVESAPLHTLGLPKGTLVALVRRGKQSYVPDGSFEVRRGDVITVLGDPDRLEEVGARFRSAQQRTPLPATSTS